jgi:PTH1 family peptidyl-tRNA hydrolase
MKNWFTTVFSSNDKTPQIDPMNKFLIAGLGNIGAEYASTRHNIGFMILDYLASQESLSFTTARYGAVAEYRFKGKHFFMLKPNTFMNLSGKAVKFWLDKENIPLENLLVITDDLNLPFGSIRIKPKGSDGGHNGLKSIQQILGTQNYPRLRFGISDEFKKGQQVNYVLGKWDENEWSKLPERLTLCSEVIKSFGAAGLDNTMTAFNGK